MAPHFKNIRRIHSGLLYVFPLFPCIPCVIKFKDKETRAREKEIKRVEKQGRELERKVAAEERMRREEINRVNEQGRLLQKKDGKRKFRRAKIVWE
ncbi:hypothetical protein BJ508DRAFT_411591 [Ascobolus immersus RN42]|uniref:Uncharacterized protein n=1 Tax=Ascobolus immersus RN42 TaxID=1160509 RepID=A0A3N4IWI4_ASCIM|nr:hypothetical protein BJ508DRAFT_411591 [Ascobolus immersus RN42]